MYKKNYRFLVMGLIFSALAVTGCSNNQKTEETVIESTANTEYESNEEAAGETVTEDDTDDEYEVLAVIRPLVWYPTKARNIDLIAGL